MKQKRELQRMGDSLLCVLPIHIEQHFEKNDFFRAMKNRLVEGKPIAGVTDHIFCPTFIDDIAQTLGVLISKNATGIYHVTGSQALSPYDAALTIADVYNLTKILFQRRHEQNILQEKQKDPWTYL